MKNLQKILLVSEFSNQPNVYTYAISFKPIGRGWWKVEIIIILPGEYHYK